MTAMNSQFPQVNVLKFVIFFIDTSVHSQLQEMKEGRNKEKKCLVKKKAGRQPKDKKQSAWF